MEKRKITLGKILSNEVYAQPTYKEYMNRGDVLSVNPGKDIHKFDNENNKKHFTEETKKYVK